MRNLYLEIVYFGLGLGCLMPFSTILQLHHGGQFYWWRKPEYPGKHCRPGTDKLYQRHSN